MSGVGGRVERFRTLDESVRSHEQENLSIKVNKTTPFTRTLKRFRVFSIKRITNQSINHDILIHGHYLHDSKWNLILNESNSTFVLNAFNQMHNALRRDKHWVMNTHKRPLLIFMK